MGEYDRVDMASLLSAYHTGITDNSVSDHSPRARWSCSGLFTARSASAYSDRGSRTGRGGVGHTKPLSQKATTSSEVGIGQLATSCSRQEESRRCAQVRPQVLPPVPEGLANVSSSGCVLRARPSEGRLS